MPGRSGPIADAAFSFIQLTARRVQSKDPVKQSIRLLLADSEESFTEKVQAALTAAVPTLSLRRVSRMADVVAALETASADLIISDTLFPDGCLLEALENRPLLLTRVPVVVCTHETGQDFLLSLMKLGVRDYIHKEEAAVQACPGRLLDVLSRRLEEQRHVLRKCEEERMRVIGAAQSLVSRLRHEISNPLAIISGNAQLLLELARLGGLTDDIRQPLEDVEEASRRITELLGSLPNLKETVAAGLPD